MPKLSFIASGVIVGILTIVLILSVANYNFGLHWFGNYGKRAIAIVAVLLAIDLLFIHPFFHEIYERTRNQNVE